MFRFFLYNEKHDFKKKKKKKDELCLTGIHVEDKAVEKHSGK